MGTLARSLSTGIVSLMVATAQAQFSIVPGEYIDDHLAAHKIVLLVAKPSGKNWTVRGTHKVYTRTYPLSGTLYASGKLALKPNQLDPKNKKSPWYHYEDGSFDPETGAICFRVYLGGARPEPRGSFLFGAYCINSKNKPEMETVWVLKEGFPRYDAMYENSSKPFSVDPSGSMTWPATSLKDGRPISQKFTFTAPKSEYKHGERYMAIIDATGTEKGAVPYVVCIMYFGWRDGGQIMAGNDNAAYNISVGFKFGGEVTFDPRDESQAAILVGAPGMGGMRWEYQKVERPKKPTARGKSSMGGAGTALPSSARIGTTDGDATVRMPERILAGSSPAWDRYASGRPRPVEARSNHAAVRLPSGTDWHTRPIRLNRVTSVRPTRLPRSP